jgi:hypothetical protein
METENENEVKPPTVEQRQSIVAVLDRLDVVAAVVMEIVGEHRGHGRIATDQ